VVDFKKILLKYSNWKILLAISLIFLLIIAIFLYQLNNSSKQIYDLEGIELILREKLNSTEKELKELKNQDQVKRNNELQDTITKIEDAYKKALTTYEKLLDLEVLTADNDYAELFAESLSLLSERNYASASASLDELNSKITAEQAKAATAAVPSAANLPVQNTPPSSGYSRQRVSIDIGEFVVDIVTADLNSTRVIVDTASDSDCRDNCPVLSLGDYVARSGAFAGINGSYFCPAEYPSCAGKTNSFDTLAMNKNKVYLNSENNVYSTVPAVIFLGNSARFVGASQEWGRDTGVDSVLANQPLLVSGGNVAFGGGSDPKQGSKGSRSFVGTTGSTVYIGVVHNATVAEVARVLQQMGIQNALNLDSGGSTALWSGGYKVGPGRNIPNALLFVRK